MSGKQISNIMLIDAAPQNLKKTAEAKINSQKRFQKNKKRI